ncbi:hypothetical protein Bbelb_241160 [Branchiostoma belcheri]|nr:hypothetical protein Bbelb_241160 [Branchiostoma belcheri]
MEWLCAAAAAVDKQQVVERVEDLLSSLQELAEEKENAAVPEMDDDGIFKMKGCEDHQEGDEWGTSDHDNCNCQGPYRFCYHVDCLPGSEITRDSKGLWDCPGGFATGDDSVADDYKNDVDISMLEKSLRQILQEDASDPEAADDTEIPAVADGEALDIRGLDDDVLVTKEGCEGHKENSGAHQITATASVENQTASAILLSVFLVLKLNLTPTSSGHRLDPMTAATAFGVFTGVVGLVGFAMDRYESAQTTAQLNEIQDQIRELDGKIEDLTRSVSDLQLGQEYLQQVILYGRDELRLRNVLDTLASIRASNGQYVGSELQGWADSVLSHDSDGIRNVLFNLLDMVQPQSSLFGGTSLFEIYRQQRNTNAGDLEQDMVKMRLKVAQVYGLIGGGYCAWATALRIKGRQGDIPAVVQEGKTKLNDVEQSLQPYFDYVSSTLR